MILEVPRHILSYLVARGVPPPDLPPDGPPPDPAIPIASPPPATRLAIRSYHPAPATRSHHAVSPPPTAPAPVLPVCPLADRGRRPSARVAGPRSPGSAAELPAALADMPGKKGPKNVQQSPTLAGPSWKLSVCSTQETGTN